MPGWHEATQAFRDAGDLQVVGIVEEQHGDRAELFMQWKQMDWPVMVDAQNLLGVTVVPIVILIDEHGIVRDLPRGAPGPSVEEFLAATFEAPSDVPATAIVPSLGALAEAARLDDTAEAWRAYGRALGKSADADDLDTAVEAFTRAIELDPDDAPTQFQLGVAYRSRYDSPARRPDDFQDAVDAWARALAMNPNQYIWRRRIQQYGPRLIKPYPFYDWVAQARTDIEARGATPAALVTDPSGAEIARPALEFAHSPEASPEPDPDGRIDRDRRGFVEVETTVVPSGLAAGQAARVHLVFRPDPSMEAHWNNEAEPMTLWVAAPAECEIDARAHALPNPPAAVSHEPRRFEFEVHVPKDAEPGRLIIPAYALYNVCEGEDGRCLYRRKNIQIEIDVTP